MRKQFRVGLAVATWLWVSSFNNIQAAVYMGNGSTSGGGAVGNGTLTLSGSANTISATFTKGGGSFNDVMVLFIDSESGGFANTSSFSDNTRELTRAISGLSSGGSRATANFASGFRADYAIAFGVNQNGAIYHLISGNDLSSGLVRNFNINPHDSPNSASYTFSFDRSELGLGTGASFAFQSTYLTASGSRYLESFESLTGTGGFNEVTFGNFSAFGAVPEPTNTALAVCGVVGLGAALVSRMKR